MKVAGTNWHKVPHMLRILSLLVVALGSAGFAVYPRSADAAELVAIPPGHEADLRFFEANGGQLDGMAAFKRMANADLTVWVAGNQFFAMTRVIGDFQARHPGMGVGLMTLPPGMILKAIQAGGWSLGDVSLTLHPDVFATVSVTQLRDTALVSNYIVYMHNALELMVAKGNPRGIRDLHDLTRADLRVMLPNPLTEGIMSFYGKPILQRQGLWAALSPGVDCADCAGAPNVHFTTVHHREIPAGIESCTADVGLVWRTETLAAVAGGAAVEGIPLPPDQNAAEQVSYVAAALNDSPHSAVAAAFIGFLSSQPGQDAYATYGFLPATKAERTLRPLPPN
jgi:ABC-type molybdate transport system substrate-binding protein